MARKKRKNEILEEMKPAFGLAGVSIGSSILGGALQPHLPAGVTNPLTATGTATSKFVAPMAVLGVGSYTFKKLKKLEKKVNKKKKK